MKIPIFKLSCAVFATAVVTSCGSFPESDAEAPEAAPPPVEAAPAPLPEPAAEPEAIAVPSESPEDEGAAFYQPGTGVFTARAPSAGNEDGAGEFTLNLEGTDIREAVKIVLGDMLGANYSIDPRVKGTATLQTSRPIAREDLLPALETLLKMNGAAIIPEGSMYRIVPAETARQAGGSAEIGRGTHLPQGYHVRVVPLRYIAASEMRKILEPLSAENVINVDQNRNLLVLTGSGPELSRMLEMVDIFDVNWLEGMSVALFTPKHVDAVSLADDLNRIFGEGPLKDLVRLTAIERLNAVMAMSPQEDYLRQVSDWVRRLDLDQGSAGIRLYVYQVRNGKAADLADVLAEVFGTGDFEGLPPEGALAPGLAPVRIAAGAEIPPPDLNPDGLPEIMPPPPDMPAVDEEDEGVALVPGSHIRIIADEANNALVILATAGEYEQIEAALKQLDVVPMQVLIEATIAEITLTDEFQFGLEWFFDHELDIGDASEGRGTLDLDDAAGLAARVPGFSYAAIDAAGLIRGVLNTLAADSRLNVLSSPSLMVLNNQTANIQVGDQVPVTIQQQQATIGQSSLVNTIEFRDTGVQLAVTPRINPGGLVTMEIAQEVSDVAPGSANSLTPTIQQRRIESTVAVKSGETVVLGGLIRENRNQRESGIPYLYKIPIIGALFGRTTEQQRRTELVVLITPRAVQGADQARQITQEFRNKMESLKPPFGPSAAAPAAPLPPAVQPASGP